MWQRHGPGALVALTILIGGCGKSDGPSQGTANPAPAAPVQMSIPSGDSPATLGPDTIQAAMERAGTGVQLAKLDLSPAGLPLTMNAPEGAKVQKDNLDIQVTSGDRFAVRIQLGKRRLERKRQQMAGQQILVNAKDLVLAESSLLLAVRCEFARHLVVGHQDYCVENVAPVYGKQVNHSQADCLLMLHCVGTLAPSAPLPDEPVAALQQLKARVTKGADGRATGMALAADQTTDATLALVAKIAGLERLDLHGCPITDEGLPHLAGLTSLKTLILSDCEFTDAGLSSLAGLTNLEELRLASSFGDSPQIKGPGLAALAGMTKLQVLVLDKDLVDDAALVHLKNVKGLRELHLELTHVAGPGLANLKELKDLQTLNLGNTPLTDAALANLAGLTGLKRLLLEGTQVSDAGLEHLHGLKGLRQVALARTKVTQAGADMLKAALPGVEITIK